LNVLSNDAEWYSIFNFKVIKSCNFSSKIEILACGTGSNDKKSSQLKRTLSFGLEMTFCVWRGISLVELKEERMKLMSILLLYTD
jgi:hypothetical protein